MPETTYVCQICGAPVDATRAETIIERTAHLVAETKLVPPESLVICLECAAIDMNRKP